ncbi:STAS domain-containing protein [Streptomyces sp. NPDC090106]|uniref:STAS domain-containing protein n=1 Tax=Streptomyces sp. NPDC090106 TaxID=3365946 RepID=UPI00380700AC
MHENDLGPAGPDTRSATGGHALLRTANGLLIAELRGDLDLASALPLSLWLDTVLTRPAPAYVVDVRPVSFLDSAGLGVLLRFRRRVIEAGPGFALVCDTGRLRLLRAHGSLATLNPVATLAEAVTRLGAPAG